MPKKLLTLILSLALLFGGLHWTRAAGTTFTVTTTTDADDSDYPYTTTNDGLCNSTAGGCSLRAAIEQGNKLGGAITIHFSIGSGAKTLPITVGALPTITAPTTIDGTTQPGFSSAPIITLDGSSLTSTKNGLTISAGSSTVRGLIIINFPGDGLDILTNGGNMVAGNYIGTNGTTAAPNATDGIFINCGNNTIGGTTSSDRNVIAGNGNYGILISGAPATGNVVKGNYIGTNAAGSAVLQNASSGIGVSSGSNNTIGGSAAGAGNVIAGSKLDGVTISFGSGNVVQGNIIGLDASGTVALANNNGINITQSSNTPLANSVIGNVISGNKQSGITTNNDSGDTIQGNFIGTNSAGTAAIGNGLNGLRLLSKNTMVGGATANLANIIAGNKSDGVYLFGNGNTVQGNFIGTNSSGTSLGNTGNGILVSSGTANLIESNFIFSNTKFGIALTSFGPTLNDNGDGDTGPNNRQNYPVITGGAATDTQITIQGTLNSTANTTFRIELFSNAACDSSGYGEGQNYLGFVNVTTNGSGNATFSTTTVWTAGAVITATATDSGNNTSEFSHCFTATVPKPDPANAAPMRNLFTTATPTLTWNAVTGATDYEVEVAQDAAFKNLILDAPTNGKLYVTLAAGVSDGTYYWRVRAKNGSGGYGAWSAAESFRVKTT